ncbi:hypothetical protein EZJ19_12725 [Parasulfuritortus cantonensis]|uniref:Uncharacterized protein n=1 Tax=Parasulfuritortus cantonensis TaxID=2528202 RepID=A0A4R1B8F9_9PROT|nr:hypothetical protein EZJ19_12725 [Parasulfuritortus cantonensis]
MDYPRVKQKQKACSPAARLRIIWLGR